jgi:hypothetical protein
MLILAFSEIFLEGIVRESCDISLGERIELEDFSKLFPVEAHELVVKSTMELPKELDAKTLHLLILLSIRNEIPFFFFFLNVPLTNQPPK